MIEQYQQFSSWKLKKSDLNSVSDVKKSRSSYFLLHCFSPSTFTPHHLTLFTLCQGSKTKHPNRCINGYEQFIKFMKLFSLTPSFSLYSPFQPTQHKRKQWKIWTRIILKANFGSQEKKFGGKARIIYVLRWA